MIKSLARFVLSACLMLVLAPALSHAVPLEVYGGMLRAPGADALQLDGALDWTDEILSIDLTADNGMTIQGDLQIQAIDDDTFSFVSGQTLSFGGAEAMVTGTCQTGGTFTCNLTALGSYRGVINNLTAGVAYTTSPIPEPGSAALFGLGLVLVGAAVRREP